MEAEEIIGTCWGPKPPGWKLGNIGNSPLWEHHGKRLRVIASIDTIDSERWLHVSISNPRRLPTYKDLCYMKRHWFGEEATAVEIHAPKSEHVNYHKYCRHLWTNLDRDFIPDVRRYSEALQEMTI